MLTPQQIQAVQSEAKARGYDPSKTQRYLQFMETQLSGSTFLQPTPIPQPKPKSNFNLGGAIKSIVKDPVQTLLVKPAVRTAQAGIAAYGAISGNQRALDYSTQDQNVKLPLLGNFKVEGQKTGLAGIKQVSGDAAKSASYLYTPGKVIGTLGKTATTGNKILQGAKAGTIGGGLYSGGQAGIENKSFKDIAVDTLTGAATGAVIGGAIPAAVSGIKTLQKIKLTNLPRIEKPSIFQNKLSERRLTELDKLDSYASVRKSSEVARSKGFDVKKILAETDLLHNSVDEAGTIRTSTTDGAIQQVQDFLKPQESIIGKSLKKEGKEISLSLVESKLKAAVNESGLKGGAKVRALKNVEDDIAGYALDADKKGNISLSVIQDAKVDKYSNINYLNPESKRADKAIAKGLKQLIEENTKSIDVKQLNNELSKYFSLINYLEKLDGKKVEGGRLGKYFAQTLGGIVGSHFGPIGTMAGAEIAGKIKGYQMASKFGKKIGNDLKISPVMEKAIKNLENP